MLTHSPSARTGSSMPRRSALAFLGIMALSSLAMPMTASAQLFLLYGGRGRGMEFSPEDWDLFKQSMREVLERGDIGSRSDWNNPKTGFRGDMLVENAYEWEGLPCHRVSFTIARAKEQVPYRLNFCKTAAGEWAIGP